MEIAFSHHAQQKFEILKQHGWRIKQQQVENTIRHPSKLDHSRDPLIIAQTPLDKTHVLRVVYRQKGDEIFVITFYPGRINQYGQYGSEKELY